MKYNIFQIVYPKKVNCLTFSFDLCFNNLIIEFLKYDFEHLLFHWLVDACVASREIVRHKVKRYIFAVVAAVKSSINSETLIETRVNMNLHLDAVGSE